MARQEPNCLITRNFAFGGKQYKKKKKFYLEGEVKEFAALNRCAVMIKTNEPEAKEEKKPFFSKAPVIEGSNVAP